MASDRHETMTSQIQAQPTVGPTAGAQARRSPVGASVLGPVASTRLAALYVVKIGSASLHHEAPFDQIAQLCARGARVLLVAGGADGIADHYQRIGRAVQTLTLRNGDEVRYCTLEEMAHIVEAYEHVTLPLVRRGLHARGLTVYASTSQAEALVSGRANAPLRVVREGRVALVRDHRAGVVTQVDAERLHRLLGAFDVVCLSPPMADEQGTGPLNVDADVLAAQVANAMGADHLRLVTGTAGLLQNVMDPTSRLTDAHPGQGALLAKGRMRQKVRAAELALSSPGDVAITGPHKLNAGSGTRFWRGPAPSPDLELLSRAVQIPSVSGDERELAEYLLDWCQARGIEAGIDVAGNFVATRGAGEQRLLMLGHLDTVAHLWAPRWDGDTLSGRGSVDAKGSLIAFLQTLAETSVPERCQVRVVGAVQEETTSAGAFYVREHYHADAVIVGEPSGAAALTIGYFGLYKVRLWLSERVGHTAGRGVSTAADLMTEILTRLRTSIAEADDQAMMAALGIHAVNDGDYQRGEAVIDVRVPPALNPEDLVRLFERECAPARAEVLRATPGILTARTSPLVTAFTRGFREEGIRPRFLAKKGSSDMNTLVQTWGPIPMVAYGPGDAALDHTPHEHLWGQEFRQARRVLTRAVAHWIASGANLERRTLTGPAPATPLPSILPPVHPADRQCGDEPAGQESTGDVAA